jgi:hypothetical protein
MRAIQSIGLEEYVWYVRKERYKYMDPERMLLILAEMQKDEHKPWRDNFKLSEILRVENELKQKVKKVA